MKKQFIPILIIIMSIALIGIIAVQLFWIRNAIKVKEEQLDRSINGMLAEVVDKLETTESMYMISNCIIDSIPEQDIDSTNNVQHKKVMKISNGQIDIDHILKSVDSIKDGTKVKSMTFSTSINTCDNENTEEVKSIVMSAGNDSMKIIINQFADNKKVKIDKLVDKMIYEVDISGMPVLKRIKTEQLDTLIKRAMNNKGLDFSFDFAIYSEGKDSVEFCSKNFKKENHSSDYRINLFPNDLVQKDDYLLINFPDKSNRIYSELSLLMGGSLIFTLIILIVFFITIRTIIRQKKLSDIKSDFINNMTHEFKTPIATISLAADSIENPITLNNKEQILHFTRLIKEENKRMNNQVENVLQMALVDKKSFELELKKHDINPLIEDAIAKISLKLEKSKGILKSELNAETHYANVDPMHFTNIIFNLLDNAIKYSNDKPEIMLITLNKDGKLYIQVSDKGIGIRKEEQDRIFEKFYRVSTGNVHNVKGHGLGLSYVKAIVETFGGSISIVSEIGKGSTFTIILPFSI